MEVQRTVKAHSETWTLSGGRGRHLKWDYAKNCDSYDDFKFQNKERMHKNMGDYDSVYSCDMSV